MLARLENPFSSFLPFFAQPLLIKKMAIRLSAENYQHEQWQHRENSELFEVIDEAELKLKPPGL
jgi:hypothetical protein